MREAVSWLINLAVQGVLVAWVLAAFAVLALRWTKRWKQVQPFLQRHATSASILTVAALVVFVQDGFRVVRASTEIPEVRLPTWKLTTLPLQLDDWQGQEVELDPKLFRGSEAYETVSRIYRNSTNGHTVKLFFALYTDPKAGVWHTPINCYRANGATLLRETQISLKVEGRSDLPPIEVSLSTWNNREQRDQVLVLYWYELGAHVLFDRWDLGKARWNLRGQETWPPMFKILLETSAAGGQASQADIVEVAGLLRAWLSSQPAP